MSKRPSPYDLITIVPSETETGVFYEIKRHRETHEYGCSCRSFSVAPTCDECGHVLTRRRLEDRTVYDCSRCHRFDIPRSCKHLRQFKSSQEPGPIVVAKAMLSAVEARRRSPKNTAVSMTATIKQPIHLEDPVRAIILPDD